MPCFLACHDIIHLKNVTVLTHPDHAMEITSFQSTIRQYQYLPLTTSLHCLFTADSAWSLAPVCSVSFACKETFMCCGVSSLVSVLHWNGTGEGSPATLTEILDSAVSSADDKGLKCKSFSYYFKCYYYVYRIYYNLQLYVITLILRHVRWRPHESSQYIVACQTHPASVKCHLYCPIC